MGASPAVGPAASGPRSSGPSVVRSGRRVRRPARVVGPSSRRALSRRAPSRRARSRRPESSGPESSGPSSGEPGPSSGPEGGGSRYSAASVRATCRSSRPAREPSSSRAATAARRVPIGISTPSPRTAAARASTRSRMDRPSTALTSQIDRVAVPDGLGERITRAFFSARFWRRFAHSGSIAAAVSSMRRMSSPTGSSGASGRSSEQTRRAWSSARSRVHSQNRCALGSSSHPLRQRVADLGQPIEQIVGQVELAADIVRDQPRIAETSSPENSSSSGRRSLRPACARPRWCMASRKPGRGLALGPRARPDVGRQVLTGQRRRRQPLQGGDQPRAGRERVQLGREAGRGRPGRCSRGRR